MSNILETSDFFFNYATREFHMNPRSIKREEVEIKNNLLNDPENDNRPIYEKLIDELGVNWYNLKAIMIISFLLLADGGEMVVISLLNNKLADEWELSQTEKGLLGSSVFMGLFLGSLLSGKASDTKGRKPIFRYGTLISTVFAFLSAFGNSFFSFLLFRTICGFGIGLSIPAAFALATEITPTHYRAYVVNGVWAFFAVGEMFVILLSKYFLEKAGGWRLILVFASVPCFIAYLFSFFVDESPKFLIYNDKKEEGLRILKNMTGQKEFTQMGENITEEKVVYELQNSEQNKVDSNFYNLISVEYIRLSILIWVTIYLLSFIYYGVIYILPQSLEAVITNKLIDNKSDSGDIYGGLLFAAFVEIPSYLSAGYVSNIKSLGRIKSMATGLFIGFFSFSLAFFFSTYLSFFCGIGKISICLPFNILICYVCEAYPTKIRSIALGMTYAFTRFGGITTPLVSQYIYAISPELPYLSYSFASLISATCVVYLPFDTIGRVIH